MMDDVVTGHLKRALEEYAEKMGKTVQELTLAQRNQAFYNYRLEGRQFEAKQGEFDGAGIAGGQA